MKYNASNYIGKKIQLYPGDSYSKYGVILNVDDLGWIVKITQSRCDSYKTGKKYFISHSKSFTFEFLDE